MVLVMQSKKRGVKIDPTLGLQGLSSFPPDLYGCPVSGNKTNKITTIYPDIDFANGYWENLDDSLDSGDRNLLILDDKINNSSDTK